MTDDNPDGALDDATVEGFQHGVRGDRPRSSTPSRRTSSPSTGSSRSARPSGSTHSASHRGASPKGTATASTAFGTTDFRDDLAKIDVPTLVIHGDSDAVVPFEKSGKRTAEAVKGAQLVVIEGAPHGFNASHAQQFNDALLGFLKG